MYLELTRFTKHIFRQKSIWTDGELWTAFVGGILCYFWFECDKSIVPAIRSHFGDLLGVTSIIFGFALAALIFYIQAAGTWANDPKVKSVAEMLVDWHIWTVIWMLFLIGWIIALWSMGRYLVEVSTIFNILHSVLAFMLLYVGFQILNHTLTVWWSFIKRDRLGRIDEKHKKENSQ